MSTKQIFDETDLAIFEFLSEDARIPNREIAHRLGISDGTVRMRINRMQEEKRIRIAAYTPEFDLTAPALCYLGLRVDLPEVNNTCKKLSELDEVRFVASTLGRFDIFAIVVINSVNEINRFVSEKVKTVSGVRRCTTSIVTETFKFDVRYGKVF